MEERDGAQLQVVVQLFRSLHDACIRNPSGSLDARAVCKLGIVCFPFLPSEIPKINGLYSEKGV